ncbi:ADP-ribose pyrophosphatase [Arthrobacter sp. MYb227]|uniref:NUDIX domain-containing protein n=1 Tax=Arthrobacter sp. MYb227 TaxID=1848601 RepID=UPI000CFBAEFB|nr:NUDIX hydrolase [Arthrobacter sp. MYb227]PQZ88635.1 ADP-ribose pyrophosphatase [Arthrobacter sp. MYb227]
MAMTDGEVLSDSFSPRRLLSSQTVYKGRIWDVAQEEFEYAPGMDPLVRDFIKHPGAVAVVVLNDADEVLMINQYRHPVGMKLWEIPAGLMDIEGEPPHVGAARELAEEADLIASDWSVLVDLFLSPGSSSEAIRIYLARHPVPVPEDQRHERTDEESDMEVRWVPLDEAVDAVLAGRIHNPSAVAGLLAAVAARSKNYASLRAVDTPFDAHPLLRSAEPRL